MLPLTRKGYRVINIPLVLPSKARRIRMKEAL